MEWNHCGNNYKNIPLPKFLCKTHRWCDFFPANKIDHVSISTDFDLFFLVLKQELRDRLSVRPFCVLTQFLFVNFLPSYCCLAFFLLLCLKYIACLILFLPFLFFLLLLLTENFFNSVCLAILLIAFNHDRLLYSNIIVYQTSSRNVDSWSFSFTFLFKNVVSTFLCWRFIATLSVFFYGQCSGELLTFVSPVLTFVANTRRAKHNFIYKTEQQLVWVSTLLDGVVCLNQLPRPI